MKKNKILNKIFNFEPIIVWIRYFSTIKLKNFITNFGIPIIVCVVLSIFSKDKLVGTMFDIFGIGSILVGFCSSILIMLFTIEGKNTNKLKETKLSNRKISLHQALIYKFSFIVINLLVLISLGIFAVFFCFQKSFAYNLIIVFILLNTILTLIEALTNVIFCLSRNEEE